MNRKQKVAVVVGALVIALLALFPPWVSRPWSDGGAEARLIPVYDWWHFVMSPPPHARGERTTKAQGSMTVTRSYEYGPPVIDHSLRTSLQAAALALTAAAVVVLKERKA